MLIQLHKKARTTPAIRQEIRTSTLSERKLAKKYGITRSSVRKWKQREDVHDRSHRPHHLATTLSAAQEAIVVELKP
ncbi:MAG: IS481 family transposase, partial [Thiobacillaceae bacterium]|nr:IS481 family transposase [Thiobacillaceae bacterium]